MKFQTCLITIIALLTISSVAHAVNAVIVDAKGDVTVTAPGKPSAKPATGLELPRGTSIKTGANAKATILLSDGQIAEIKPGSTYTVGQAQTSASTPIRGITVALNEASQPGSAPRVQGMVKAAEPLQSLAIMTPERKVQMDADLKKVDEMKLGENGRRLMIAQVYYKYRQYSAALKPLLQIYGTEIPPSPTVKKLIALVYEKMGNPDEAKKYR